MMFFIVVFLCACQANENEQNETNTSVETTDSVQQENEKEYTVDFKNEGRREEATKEEDSVEAEEVVEQAEEIEVVKKGRGYSDISRNEPEYEGLVGYVAINSWEIDNEYDEFPAMPWSVKTVEQTGPDVGDLTETDTEIPHKTKVKVLEQHLNHEGYGRYAGWLLVETVEEQVQKYKINVNNFLTYAYWNRGTSEAAKMAPCIATYNGKGEKPYKKDEYVDVEVGTQVYVSGIEYGGEVTAYVYREWKLGYGGVKVTFDPDSLDIVY